MAAAEDLCRRWEGQLAGIRSDAAARRLAALLPEHPVVTAPPVAEMLGVTGPTARAALGALAARGILQPLELRPTRPGRPAQWWMAAELVAVVALSRRSVKGQLVPSGRGRGPPLPPLSSRR